jgi:hypothetical protein
MCPEENASSSNQQTRTGQHWIDGQSDNDTGNSHGDAADLDERKQLLTGCTFAGCRICFPAAIERDDSLQRRPCWQFQERDEPIPDFDKLRRAQRQLPLNQRRKARVAAWPLKPKFDSATACL